MPAGADGLFDRRTCIKIDDFEGAVAIAGIEPAAVGDDAVRSGVVVIDGTVRIERYSHKADDGPLEGERAGVDDVDPVIGAVAEIVFSAQRIDPADIERT
jgi:hypothetical protein